VIATFTVLVLAAVAMFSIALAWFDVSFSKGVGDRVYQPASASALKHTYALGVGNLELDLTHLQPVTTTTTIHAKLGVGKLHIIVPRDLPVAVDAHAKVGQLDVLQQHEGGHNIDVSTPGRALLVIDAKVGAGQVNVERVTR
jgi:hypothetical protein